MTQQFHTKIVGVTHANPDGSDRQDLLEDLADVGDEGRGIELQLRREPENSYDRNAIAVLDPRGRQLGYLSKDVASSLAPQVDHGVSVRCRVSEITGGGLEMYYGVNVILEIG